MLLLCSDCSHLKSCNTDLTVFVNRVFDDIVQVLSNAQLMLMCLYCKNYFKFWWNEELAALKESSIESNKVRKAAGKPRAGPIFDRRQACRLTYRRRIKEAVPKILTSYMRLYSVNIIQIFGKDGSRNLSL